MNMKEFSVKLALATLAVFAPAKSMFLSSLLLIFVDLVTGVMASHKQKIPITSSGLRRTVTKLFVYEVGIMMAFLVQQYMTGEAIPVCNIITGMIGLTELTSVFENLNIIGGQNLLKAVIEKLGSTNKSQE